MQSLDRKTKVTDANKVGTGRENLPAALVAVVALDPVSVGFGAVPAGSGATLRSAIVLTNTGGARQTYTLGVVDPTGAGVSYSLPGTAMTLAPGHSASVTVTQLARRGAGPGPGHKQAVLQVRTGGKVVANAMLYALMK